MDKLRVLIVGGSTFNIKKDVRNLIDFEHIEQDRKFNSNIMRDAKAIVLLHRWVSGSVSAMAKDTARARGIPCIMVETGNYIIHELRERGLLASEQAEESKKEQTQPAELSLETQLQQELGLTPEDLVSKYLASACEAITELIEPGQKLHEDDLMEVLVSTVGLKAEYIKEYLIPEVALKGMVANTVGKTWKRMGPGVFFEVDTEEVEPRKRRHGTTMKTLVEQIRALPEGPYGSRWALAKEMERYTEFRKEDGTPYTRAYLSRIVELAEEDGVVSEIDGKKYVDHDPSQKPMTVAPNAEPSDLQKVSLPEPLKPEPMAAPVKAAVQSVPQQRETSVVRPASPPAPRPVPMALLGDDAKKEQDGYKSLARKIGHIEVPRILGSINILKNLLPQQHWDEAATKQVHRRLKEKGLPEVDIPRVFFENEEWDALAWETLKRLPIEIVVPAFMEDLKFENTILTCKSCLRQFAFTAADQKQFQRRYGNVIPPSNCMDCVRLRKTEGGDRT